MTFLYNYTIFCDVLVQNTYTNSFYDKKMAIFKKNLKVGKIRLGSLLILAIHILYQIILVIEQINKKTNMIYKYCDSNI